MENKHIKELRLGFGLSQERFARLVGVSLQSVRRWEDGLTRPLPLVNERLEELQKRLGGKEMAEPTKKDEQVIDFGFGGLFKGLGNLFDLVSKMAEEGKQEYTRTGEIGGLGDKAKAVYGFSVKTGLGGRPVVEHFGNIKATEKGAVVSEDREPMVDVFDEKDSLLVIAELPGVEENNIKIEIRDDIMDLSAVAKGRTYHKEILLPSKVDSRSMKSACKNGILEVRLEKKI
ncbi:MAG: helix-turn-helix domain-containing protein [Chloroflexi bacterium]|nr:helix-turn-helix domain-containing protein [Chloroflexota bacterium]